MATRNKVELIGNVGDTPKYREIETGDKAIPVVVFLLATNESWKGKDGEKKTKTTWHRIVAYRSIAETINKYVKKGALLFIDGRIQYREYEKDEQTHYITEIVVTEFQFLDKKKDDENQPEQPPKGMTAAPAAIDPEDIPF